jgi:hypothetical protein
VRFVNTNLFSFTMKNAVVVVSNSKVVGLAPGHENSKGKGSDCSSSCTYADAKKILLGRSIHICLHWFVTQEIAATFFGLIGPRRLHTMYAPVIVKQVYGLELISVASN